MAQIVKLEPGDILVLGNCGLLPQEDGFYQHLERLRDSLGLGKVLLFEGDVDLSSIPAGGTPDAVAAA